MCRRRGPYRVSIHAKVALASSHAVGQDWRSARRCWGETVAGGSACLGLAERHVVQGCQRLGDRGRPVVPQEDAVGDCSQLLGSFRR